MNHHRLYGVQLTYFQHMKILKYQNVCVHTSKYKIIPVSSDTKNCAGIAGAVEMMEDVI